jgi:hypothetical protein
MHKRSLRGAGSASLHVGPGTRTDPLAPYPEAPPRTGFSRAHPVPDAGAGGRPITRAYASRKAARFG